jgi:periplasmic divalent cation tolerance protein
MTDYIQVVTTTEREEDAMAIARELVEERLAGCVQVVGPVVSVPRTPGLPRGTGVSSSDKRF